MEKFKIIFLSIILFLSCNKNCDFPGSYTFEIPVSLSPAKDTFNIGDTITVISNFTDMVYERKTNEFYKLENIQFYPGTGIVKIDTLNQVSRINDHFDIFFDTVYQYELQQFSEGQQYLFGQYNYKDNAYSLKFRFVPKSKGLFYLQQGVDPTINPNQTFEGKCSNNKTGLDGVVKLNNGADNNIHMLSSSPDPHYNTWTLNNPQDRFHKFGGYCFYVKD